MPGDSWFDRFKSAFSSKGYVQLDASDAPPTGQGREPTAFDRGTAALERHVRVAYTKPYDKVAAALVRAEVSLSGLLDSRLGPKVVAPLTAQQKVLAAAIEKADEKAKALSKKLDANRPAVGAKEAGALEDALDALREAAKGVGPAIVAAQKVLEARADEEAKGSLQRLHGQLHPKTVAVFDGLEQANKVLSILVGVVATAVGHPEVGPVVKTAIGGALKAVRAGTKLLQVRADLANDELREQATPLLRHDLEDVVSEEDVGTAIDLAVKAVPKALSLAGIDLEALTDVEKAFPGFADVINAKLAELHVDHEIGAKDAQDMADAAVAEAVKQAKAKATKKVTAALAKAEERLRGKRKEGGFDVAAEALALDEALASLEDTPLELALGRVLQAAPVARLERFDVDAWRKAARRTYTSALKQDPPASEAAAHLAAVTEACTALGVTQPDRYALSTV